MWAEQRATEREWSKNREKIEEEEEEEDDEEEEEELGILIGWNRKKKKGGMGNGEWNGTIWRRGK